jgi:truncated hemoglobin YjbI
LFAPLLHWDRPLEGELDLMHPFFSKHFRAWLKPLRDACRIVVVPDLPGAKESREILATVSEAIARNKQVFFYSR